MTVSQPQPPTRCALCSTPQPLRELVDVAGYPLCRDCIESTSNDVKVGRRRIHKIREGKQIAGVCGGLADFANFDRDTFRLVVMIICVTTGIVPVLAIYMILAFALPEEP